MLWQNGTGLIGRRPRDERGWARINNRGDALGEYIRRGTRDYMFYRPGTGGGLWPLDSLVDLGSDAFQGMRVCNVKVKPGS